QAGFTCIQPNGYVADNTDLCDGDVNKTDPGACGCGVADVATTWYADTDADGLGDPNDSQAGFTCNQPLGYVADNTDLCPGVPGTVGSACDDGDPNTIGDVIDANCNCAGTPVGPICTGNEIAVVINTDASPGDITWEVRTEGGALLASGTPANANSTNTENVCLGSTPEVACYKFQLFDSFGDGIANGGWELRSSNGKLILRDDFASGSMSPANPQASLGYGSAHSFCLPLGPANIAATECGIFNNGQGNKVYCNKVTGATQYQFEFSDPDAGFIRRIVRSTYYVHFWDMVTSPLVPGVHYFARVRTNVAGPVASAHWGSGCETGLSPLVPCTQLIPFPNYGHSCNETRAFNPPTNNSFIYATPIPGATQYEFRIYNTNEGYDQTFLRNTYILQLKWNNDVAPKLVNGSTYNVAVSVKLGGTWSTGCTGACTITIDNNGGNGFASMEQTGFGEATLWPNPVRDGQVNLSINGLRNADQSINVDVQDIYGKQVFAQEFGNSGERFSTILQLPSDLASGVYMVNITVNGERTVHRLSIVR
ncbi:MAG: T9SS type A sorting domain-containing protein, partial [Bacteroidetes bacterium]|nr:T9SS type A sorting domain-containing protein [Bacteroidota bacterium]